MKKSTSKSPPSSEASPQPSTVTVSDVTLELTPPRLLKFLRGVGTRPAIYVILSSIGYNEAEHRRGWELLHAASGFQNPGPPEEAVDPKVVQAIADLDADDERIHMRIEASLKHKYPTVLATLHKAIAPGKGPAAVLYFRALLKRLDALATAKGDAAVEAKAVLKLLQARGLNEAWLQALRARLALAESLPEQSTVGTEPDTASLRAALVQARAWYEEWSTLARAEVKRKDYLILLGLAQRKMTTSPTEPKPVPTKPLPPKATDPKPDDV